MHMIGTRAALGLGLSAMLLSGCDEGLRLYRPGATIAVARDGSFDKHNGLTNGEAAIAYDPDGCQNWIIDDGVEGYSSPRFDPVSGLPVCNSKYPPGTVLGRYRSDSLPDGVPRRR